MIVIIDYGVGNIGSITSMLKKIGVSSLVSSEPEQIHAASKLILPGVGAFDKAMTELASRKLIDPLNKAVLEHKKLILGICLGAQILGLSSEEGGLPGLGWIDMKVKKFGKAGIRVPHMGWNVVQPLRPSLLFDQEVSDEKRFYFVHSYYMDCQDPSNTIATSYYGDTFACAVNKDNIFGVQFHPEKSHRFGFELLKKFANAEI